MAATLSVASLLERSGVDYDTIPKRRSRRRATRLAPAIPGDRVIKTVLLIDGQRHALAVIPKNRRIALAALNSEFRRNFRLGSPDDVVRLYPGLPVHALLPAAIGAQAELFVDLSLVGLRDVAFETRDRRALVRIEGQALPELFNGAWCGRISQPY